MSEDMACEPDRNDDRWIIENLLTRIETAGEKLSAPENFGNREPEAVGRYLLEHAKWMRLNLDRRAVK